MANLKSIVADLIKGEAKKYEGTIESVTSTPGINTTQFICGIDESITFINNNGEEEECNVLNTNNINLSIALGKIPALASLANVVKNDRTGNAATIILCGAKITLYQEYIEAGQEYVDRFTGNSYVPKSNQMYNYIVDIKVENTEDVRELKKMMMLQSIGTH